MIFFNCPECDCRIGVDDRASGKVAPCAECKAVVPVPEDDEAERRIERKRKGVKNLPDEAPHNYVRATEIITGLSIIIGPLSLVAITMAIIGLSKYERNRFGLWASLVPACIIGFVWSMIAMSVRGRS